MTGTEKRRLVAETALEYLGCNERDGTHRPIIAMYNTIRPLPRGYAMTYTDPWCAAFPSAIGQELGFGDILLPECSCDAMINLYKAKGRWAEADNHVPQVGDLVMYDWEDSGAGDNRGSADHVGIVYAVNGNKLTIIEGNISDSVDFREISINGKHVRGYCLPDYDGVGGAAKTETPQTVVSASGKTVEINLPQISYGDKGSSVEAMQHLLIGYGFSCGVDGADGEYGAKTKNALLKFQTDRGLDADGVCGKETWRALLGVQED